ncbi:hypothetical protein CEXT_190191 [Caerostris extrusa]|uniref:Uncharacterized protein n=1 Tax=Caerostris extrusa TaxID=172846 RepID=A0AAV4RHG3_CAEEX|nr:hypothetical protein CEXT_190191 [Caerostris extrusa]
MKRTDGQCISLRTKQARSRPHERCRIDACFSMVLMSTVIQGKGRVAHWLTLNLLYILIHAYSNDQKCLESHFYLCMHRLETLTFRRNCPLVDGQGRCNPLDSPSIQFSLIIPRLPCLRG